MNERSMENSPHFSFNVKDIPVMEIRREGIFLRRDNFPDFSPDDFVREFLYILENGLEVEFKIREGQQDFCLKHPEDLRICKDRQSGK